MFLLPLFFAPKKKRGRKVSFASFLCAREKEGKIVYFVKGERTFGFAELTHVRKNPNIFGPTVLFCSIQTNEMQAFLCFAATKFGFSLTYSHFGYAESTSANYVFLFHFNFAAEY